MKITDIFVRRPVLATVVLGAAGQPPPVLPGRGPSPLLFLRFLGPAGMHVTFYPGTRMARSFPAPAVAGEPQPEHADPVGRPLHDTVAVAGRHPDVGPPGPAHRAKPGSRSRSRGAPGGRAAGHGRGRCSPASDRDGSPRNRGPARCRGRSGSSGRRPACRGRTPRVFRGPMWPLSLRRGNCHWGFEACWDCCCSIPWSLFDTTSHPRSLLNTLRL